jgi:glycosyltransferase involved in cell wall biosynthesis
LVFPRLSYGGDTLTAAGMADLLRAGDCYVSPYLAEGFNLPVLEAAACGMPIICTEGGCTDDFTDPSFALHIRSRPVQLRFAANQMGDARMPDLDHLIALMLDVSANQSIGREMGLRGAHHVARNFTWDAVTALLVKALFPGGDRGVRQD